MEHGEIINLFNLHYHLVNLIQFMCHARQHMNVYICTCSTYTVHTFMHCCTCTTRTSTYPSISRVLQYYCNTTYYVCMVPVPACSLQGNMSALKRSPNLSRILPRQYSSILKNVRLSTALCNRWFSFLLLVVVAETLKISIDHFASDDKTNRPT